MTHRFTRTLATVALAFAPALASAQTTTMEFGSIGGNNYDPISQSFGDHSNLDVSNQTRTGFGNAPALCPNVSLWNTGYSGLPGVAFACTNGFVGEFFFQPLNGRTVFLQSIDLGSYPSTGGVGPDRSYTLNIYEVGSWTPVFTQAGVVGPTVNITPNVSSSVGLYMQWGTDWDVGVDNITTDVALVGTVTPEPATVSLFATGLIALAGIARKRRRTRAG